MSKIKYILLLMIITSLYSGNAHSTTTFRITIVNNSIYDMNTDVNYDSIHCFNYEGKFDGKNIKSKNTYSNIVEASTAFPGDCIVIASRLDINNNIRVQIDDHPKLVFLYTIHIEEGPGTHVVTMTNKSLENLSKYKLCLNQRIDATESNVNNPDYSYSFIIDNC